MTKQPRLMSKLPDPSYWLDWIRNASQCGLMVWKRRLCCTIQMPMHTDTSIWSTNEENMQISYRFAYRQIYLRCQSCDPLDAAPFSASFFSLEERFTKKEMEKWCSHKLQMLLCRQWYSQKRRNYRALLEAEKELQAIAHRLRQLTLAVYLLQKASHRGKYSSDKTLTQNSL